MNTEFKPQPGPQTMFAASSADIVIFGGQGGGGKSYGLLLIAARHINVPGYNAVIFRRTTGQITAEGGLWPTSEKIYQPLGLKPIMGKTLWRNKINTKTGPVINQIRFSHLQYDKDKFAWDGSQIPFIGFDELFHFEESQFWYMLTRNRSVCGVKPLFRATTNPKKNSWVRKLIDWWIGPDGLPIPERSGIIRWMARDPNNDKIIFGDTPEEVHAQVPSTPINLIKSVTFIPSKLSDNKILEDTNPDYRGNLMMQDRVTRMRLLDGNWNASDDKGDMFDRAWFKTRYHPPTQSEAVRFWDLAASEPTDTNPDPDWTRGLKMERDQYNRYIITDIASCRARPHEVQQLMERTARQDGPNTRIGIEGEGGSAGKFAAQTQITALSGYDVRIIPATRNNNRKINARPYSAQCEAGNVDILKSDWNEDFLFEHEMYSTEGIHDDIITAAAGAFRMLNEGIGGSTQATQR